MTDLSLMITVHMLDGRYHGVGDWPPSPFRLFQALVSAAHLGRPVSQEELSALMWLEKLAPPVVAAPKAKKSRTVTYYVPNNDLDTVGGDPARIAGIRTGKPAVAWLFDPQTPFMYVWNFKNDGARFPEEISRLADHLYQFGRGVDMAYAYAEIFGFDEGERRLAGYQGTIYRPTPGGKGHELRCPRQHSLKSLLRRHERQLVRLKNDALHKAPLPVFEAVSYDSPPVRLLYGIVRNDSNGSAAPYPLERVAELTVRVRDLAARRLEQHFDQNLINRIVVGRNAGAADKELRIRIIPLPSIGSEHADHQVRRLLVEVPAACPFTANDIAWAFSGLNLGIDAQTGEILDESGPLLMQTEERRMLSYYGIGAAEAARVWRTVTPVVLPCDRLGMRATGLERATHAGRVAHAVRQALRHAGLPDAEVRYIQREPFAIKGERAETFAYGTRFAAGMLYHVEIAFAEPLVGPVVIGDGRYLCLGLMAPVPQEPRDLFAFSLCPANRPSVDQRKNFLDAVRRALMGRARELKGNPGVLFSGHEADGAPARSGNHKHIFLAADDHDDDGLIDRLLVVAPWRADQAQHAGRAERVAFERVCSGLNKVFAGKMGIFEFSGLSDVSTNDRIFGRARCWASVTPYTLTRFPKRREELQSKVADDVAMECGRRGLPRPHVEIIRTEVGMRGCVRAHVRLDFEVVVQGPLMLGRDSHEGGGLFRAVDE